MAADYAFVWKTVNKKGHILGVYQQTIYGESLSKACEYFESFHGSLEADEQGDRIVITNIRAG